MRFAVYVAPPPDEPLAGLAASWLGRDAWTGHAVERPAAVSPGPAVVARLTAEPRRYGFHGTMKPPFRLAADLDAPRLRGTFADFCEGRAPVRIAALRLARIGAFFALVPDGDAPALDALAADVVRAGANVLVAGSAVFKGDDYGANIRAIRTAATTISL